MELSDNHEPSKRRETMLTVVLTALAAGGFFLFLIVVSGGFFFFVALVAGCIAGLGFFHYLLWGQAMDDEVVEEKPADDLQEPLEEDIGAFRGKRHRKRF